MAPAVLAARGFPFHSTIPAGTSRRTLDIAADGLDCYAPGVIEGWKMMREPCLLLGDCLDRMSEVEDGSVDMILADLPYGTTACKWDSVIPFEPLWAQYKRVTKPDAAIVLTASQPFTAALVMSNPEMFRYSWVWRKTKPSGFMQAKVAPLRVVEDILVFSMGRIGATAKTKVRFNPQGVTHCGDRTYDYDGTGVLGRRRKRQYTQSQTGYPLNVLTISSDGRHAHPTQKPVALMEYLIRTYTHEGETVLDNTMGSGTTGVACVNTGRKFIGIERDSEYMAIAEQRISDAVGAKAASSCQQDMFEVDGRE